MSLLLVTIIAGFILVLTSILFFDSCDSNIVDCKLHLANAIVEFGIAFFMATIIVLKIEFDLRKFRFWKFCKTISDDLESVKRLRTAPIIQVSFNEREELVRIIMFMKESQHVVQDAATFVIARDMRSQIERFDEALKRDNNVSRNVFDQLGAYLKDLIVAHRPPLYLMKAAKWSRSL